MTIQQKRFLLFKEMKKIEGEENLYDGLYEVMNDLKFADLFRSMKYKIGVIYALALEDYSIEELARSYPNEQELIDVIKVDRDLEEIDTKNIDFLVEGKEIRKFLLEVLEPVVQFLLILPDTIAFYYSIYERMNEELFGDFAMCKELVDGVCGLEHLYLPQELIRTVLERKIFLTEDREWEDKFYPLVKHLLPRSGKRFFTIQMQKFFNSLKETVTEILSGEKPEYVHKKIRFVNGANSSNDSETVEKEDVTVFLNGIFKISEE